MSVAFRVDIAGQTVPIRFTTVSFAGIREIVAADITVDINARAAKAANLSDLADRDAALANLSFVQAGTGAVTRTAKAKARDIVDARDFGAVENGTTQTAIIQTAINALASRPYVELDIPYNCKFNSALLNFTTNYKLTLRYFADDDIGLGSPTQLASGEIVVLMVHSSYHPTTNPGGGFVAEYRLSGPVHAGFVNKFTMLNCLFSGGTTFQPRRCS